MEFNKAPNLRLQHVKDGAEAMDYLQGKPPYDDRKTFPLPNVILLDLKMQRVSGFEFLEWLHKASPNHMKLIPVIVMSGSNLEQDVNQAYEMGANCYLMKPTDWGRFRKQMTHIGVFWGDYAETPAAPHI